MSEIDPNPPLVLASASPRRRELLHQAGYDFEVHPADIDEDDFPATILPSDLALSLAKRKADVIGKRFPDYVVLAADTVVAFGDQILNKPRDAEDAVRMLRLLSGTTHVVITGVAVVHQQANFEKSVKVLSAVHMRPMTDGEIKAYVATNEWVGKAGGYGIQDRDPFVRKVGGDFSNIVGLPMKATVRLLNEAGVKPRRQGA